MENKEAPISFYVLASFGLLFLIFFFLGQPGTNEQGITGNVAPTGALTVGDITSNITSAMGLAVIGAVIILVAGISFIIFKKIANKKKKSQDAAGPETPKADDEVKLPGSKLEDKHREDELTERDVDELFKGDEGPSNYDGEPDIKAPRDKEMTPEYHERKVNEKEEHHDEGHKPQPHQPEKAMANISELKGHIKAMLMKKMDKEKMLELLTKGGLTWQQIDKATEEINWENLKEYIRKCMSRKLSKSQIYENLRAKNWDAELIKKALLSFER